MLLVEIELKIPVYARLACVLWFIRFWLGELERFVFLIQFLWCELWSPWFGSDSHGERTWSFRLVALLCRTALVNFATDV